MLPGSLNPLAVFAVARVLSLFLMTLHCVIHVMYFILNIKAFMLLACSIHYILFNVGMGILSKSNIR